MIPVEVPSPVWFQDLLTYLREVPAIGPWVSWAFEWASALSVVVTAFAGATIVSLKALSKVLKGAKLLELAVKVELWAAPVIYWLKYVTVFNAQKEDKPKEEPKLGA